MSTRLLNTAFVYNGPMDTEWEPVKHHPNYEIKLIAGEASLRKIKNQKPVKIFDVNKSQPYKSVCMDGKKLYLHRVIARHYIHSNSVINIVDHYDHNRTNNNISNLRFVSRSENNTNISKHFNITYTILQQLPTNAFAVTAYNDKIYTKYYFDGKQFYYDTGAGYRVVPILENKNKQRHLYLKDVTNKYNNVGYKKIVDTLRKYYNIP